MIHQYVSDIRRLFKDKLDTEDFVVDKTGAKVIELLGASFVADEPAIFGTPSEEYMAAEIAWYESMSTNINDIYEGKEPPAAWKYAADKYGNINSNYGHLIYSEKYHNQYYNVMSELIENPFSRRATMVYNRPSIWVEFDEGGKSDFICTNAVSYYIRDEKLHVVVQMRSNDALFGFKNDVHWAKYVQQKLVDDVRPFTETVKLEPGIIHWSVQNLHVYEKHFKFVETWNGK
jgi:thymidylate synthase